MAPAPSTPTRRVRESARPRVPRTISTARESSPPNKKLRYVPGGPGGGGRYVDPDTGEEKPVGGTGPGGYNYMGPRGRVGRMNAERAGLAPAEATPTAPYTRPRRDRTDRRRRDREGSTERLSVGPRSSSATAAAAVVAQNNDGYKPREERGWEEFHPDLDIDAEFIVFSAHEVDGISPPVTGVVTPIITNGGSHTPGAETSNALDLASPVAGDGVAPDQELTPGDQAAEDHQLNGYINPLTLTPSKRRPGRPPRRGDSMLTGLGSPPAPRILPLPAQNPKERLNLPKPNYRQVDTFAVYEQDQTVGVNYVDKTMAGVGYQESDLFAPPVRKYIRVAEGSIEEDLDLAVAMAEADSQVISQVGRVEYDMDEQDDRWLEAHNQLRKSEQVEAIKPSFFEIAMTQIEKEWHSLEKRMPKPNPKPPQTHRPRSSSAAAVNGEMGADGEEQDSKCAVCDDGDCENTNAIVFCDGCDLAVHQECYGVPFIPEGQWLCRRCKDRANPTCIFCPNMDGAFKHTSVPNRWSHLLCAIWIPEVSIGNTTFMEPVQDVEKVQKQRWKLTCYICQQKMGACIQCGNKNCYQAFHVTCARRARLFLKMKSAHASGIQDASVLKAFCHKHVPGDWKRENDVDWAFREAQSFYRHAMRGRRWADSEKSALAGSANAEAAGEGAGDEAGAGNKRKRGQSQKQTWRLPSGAPIVPQVVYHNVETALTRFNIRKRKEFIAEACKYWTLKREARRGAALLKRLQMQMDSFSSMEITRRNFAGMGAAGGPKLQRRIDFAGRLEKDMEQLQNLCTMIKDREEKKLQDAQYLTQMVDTVYFPIPPLLWPILLKAQDMDSKGVFADGFRRMEDKLSERYYTSVNAFSEDIAAVFGSVIGVAVSNAASAKQELDQSAGQLSKEQKEKKTLAKRIIKSVQAMLDEANRKEADLGKKPFEQDLANLDAMLDHSMKMRRQSMIASAAGDTEGGSVKSVAVNGHTETHPDAMEVEDRELNAQIAQDFGVHRLAEASSKPLANGLTNGVVNGDSHTDSHSGTESANSEPAADKAAIDLQLRPATAEGTTITIPLAIPGPSATSVDPTTPRAPSSDPTTTVPALSHSTTTLYTDSHPASNPDPSTTDLLSTLRNGGIPWYAEFFDPRGTTLYEERYSAMDVVRDMSEELSDMDEDELKGLGVDEDMTDVNGGAIAVAGSEGIEEETPKPKPKKKKRPRGW